jgi:hypothetical protein
MGGLAYTYESLTVAVRNRESRTFAPYSYLFRSALATRTSCVRSFPRTTDNMLKVALLLKAKTLLSVETWNTIHTMWMPEL